MLQFFVVVGAFASSALLLGAIMLIAPDNREKLHKFIQIIVNE